MENMEVRLNKHPKLATRMKIKYNVHKSSRVDYAAAVMH
jgi:hypothetical protein